MKTKRQWKLGAKPGEGHWNARLTEEQVLEIRELARSGARHAALADAYGISKYYVSDIVRRRAWASLLPRKSVSTPAATQDPGPTSA